MSHFVVDKCGDRAVRSSRGVFQRTRRLWFAHCAFSGRCWLLSLFKCGGGGRGCGRLVRSSPESDYGGKMPAQFLSNPAHIRGAIGTLARESKRMDLAVAFVGRDWNDSLANFQGNLRVICWLSSTNTNPRAVRQLIKRSNTKVRQRDGMHAKVYLTNLGVVVGSANLSAKALSEMEQNGQDEAAVLLEDKISRDAIGKWFRTLWTAADTRKITKNDLNRAEEAYDKARKGKMSVGGKATKQNYEFETLSTRDRKELAELARAVKNQDTQTGLPLEEEVPQKISRATLRKLADYLTKSMGRAYLFQRALIEKDLSHVRSALKTLFDESLDIAERLKMVLESGYISPLRIPSLSAILQCRAPDKYPPFNKRTRRLLEDFGLKRFGASSASPESYKHWLDQAEALSQELDLRSPGHVDRVVWQYTKDLQL